MISPYRFILKQQTLWLSPQRAIYWEDEKALILSDLHLGKSGHFRKHGIGIPQDIFKEDLHRLFALIQYHKPHQLIIAGDMFHSHANREMDFFLKWRNDLSQISILLIKGNHDILSNDFYHHAGISVIDEKYSSGCFCFTHDIESFCEEKTDTFYTFSGHIHPGIRVRGGGKQSLMLPCYYFAPTFAILPAFSLFTGLAKVKPSKDDNIFAMVENQIMQLQ